MSTKEDNVYYKKEPELSKMPKSRFKQYINRGMTAFFIVAACILFYFILFRFEGVSDILNKIIEILQPIIFGLGIAYMLNPIVRKIDKKLLPILEKRMEADKAKKMARSIGVTTSLVFMGVLIYALCSMMIPELYRSIRNLLYSLPRQIENAVSALSKFELQSFAANKFVNDIIEQFNNGFQNWFRNDMMGQIEELMSDLTLGVVSIVGVLWDLVIGIIVSIYVLFSKDEFSAQAKKLTYAFCTTHKANLVLHLTSKANEIFSGFIIGKIIDSAIIGVICFVCLSFLNMPYTLLVSVIVGVTNIIPFFGPFIGAIPSAVLIVLAEPIKGLYFIIFILLLQQLDGNVIGPKILGSSTGLSSFWVIFSILLGGGLFGVAGMIVGVPTFALIYYTIDMITKDKLKEKKLPTSSTAYGQRSYVDNRGHYVDMDASARQDIEE